MRGTLPKKEKKLQLSLGKNCGTFGKPKEF